MANWIGCARSNSFHVNDIAALQEAVAPIHGVEVKARDGGRVLLLAVTDDGGWPVFQSGEDGDDVEIDIVGTIAPHLPDGEVVVLQEVGHEKLRYLSGWALAFNNRRDTERVDLGDIMPRAAKLGGPGAEITAPAF